MSFGFGVRVETTTCPEMDISVQHYGNQVPVKFNVSSCFGTPTIKFDDGTVLKVQKRDDHNEYELVVAKGAMSHTKKQYLE